MANVDDLLGQFGEAPAELMTEGEAREEEARARWMSELAKTCRNGCGGCAGYRPCPGCMAGGMCDEFECTCDDVEWEQGDAEERDYDPDEDRTP